jgi:Skp family chaperone for outer membrane proteins
MKLAFFILLSFSALCAHGQERPAPPEKPASRAAGKKAPEGVQKMADDFSQQREARLDGGRALLEKLKQAKSDEERERIRAEIREQQQQRTEAQREAARQAREQLRDSRK